MSQRRAANAGRWFQPQLNKQAKRAIGLSQKNATVRSPHHAKTDFAQAGFSLRERRSLGMTIELFTVQLFSGPDLH